MIWLILLCLAPIVLDTVMAIREFSGRVPPSVEGPICQRLGHKLVLVSEVQQEQCSRWRCHYWRGLTALEVEHLLDADDDEGKCHEPPPSKQPALAIEVPF